MRNDGWKLTQAGGLYDMSDSPFVEKLVAMDTEEAKAKGARKHLQAVLDEFSPGTVKSVEVPEPSARKARKKAKRSAVKP
ncbi:MAG: hypothetical protein ABIR24_12750 [Verrucomicrobiota bacterium]